MVMQRDNEENGEEESKRKKKKATRKTVKEKRWRYFPSFLHKQVRTVHPYLYKRCIAFLFSLSGIGLMLQLCVYLLLR